MLPQARQQHLYPSMPLKWDSEGRIPQRQPLWEIQYLEIFGMGRAQRYPLGSAQQTCLDQEKLYIPPEVQILTSDAALLVVWPMNRANSRAWLGLWVMGWVWAQMLGSSAKLSWTHESWTHESSSTSRLDPWSLSPDPERELGLYDTLTFKMVKMTLNQTTCTE